MRLRRFAAASAFLITSSTLTPAAAHADTPSGSTLYVSQSSSCSDSAGSGSQATPFCTVQAAVDVASPGQTVYIEYGSYPPAQITRSGTASAPINIVGAPAPRQAPTRVAWIGYQATGVSLVVTGSSYLDFSNVGVLAGPSGAVSVSGSSDITFDKVSIGDGGIAAGTEVEITGQSHAVTVERTFFSITTGTPIKVDGGSADTVISTDQFDSAGDVTVSVADAPGTIVTSNGIQSDCHGGLALTSGSTNAVIENNVIHDNIAIDCAADAPALMTVDATSSATATEDYNNVVPHGANPLYTWGGNSYTTVTAFSAATGQGAHDAERPGGTIDSADSAAPGELSTDVYGNPRVDDPLTVDTGTGPETYYDRGAIETEEPLSITQFYPSANQAPTGSPVTFTAKASSTWTSTLTYLFDFGDGATQTTTTGTASHVYSATGTFTTKVTVTGFTGVPASKTYPITVVPPAPLVAGMSVSSTGTMTAIAANQSTDSWDITGYTVDFGDGSTPIQAVAGTPHLIYSYKKLGTYTIKLTATDSQGNTATTSQQFSTAGSEYTAYGPVRVLDTRHGIGTGGATTPLGPNGTLRLKIGGNGSIPANVSAVALNLTVTDPTGGGYVTAYPDGQTRPATSNLNYTPGLTKATSVLVRVGSDGEIDLYNGSSGTVALIADVTGYFTETMASGYTPLYPMRILDTRTGLGTGGSNAVLGAGGTLTFTVAGADAGQLPASGINAVALNLTATNEATGGYVTAWPDGATRPLASSLNFPAGQTTPNTVIVPVGADGKIDLYNGSGGRIDLVADVQGYFSGTGTDAYLPVDPARLYDSRTSGGPVTDNNGPYLQPLGPNPVISGAFGTMAFVYNVTVTQPTGSGYVVVYPGFATVPQTSNVNFTTNQTTANTAIAQAGAIGTPDNSFTVRFSSPQGNNTQLIVDLFGYFSAE